MQRLKVSIGKAVTQSCNDALFCGTAFLRVFNNNVLVWQSFVLKLASMKEGLSKVFGVTCLFWTVSVMGSVILFCRGLLGAAAGEHRRQNSKARSHTCTA